MEDITWKDMWTQFPPLLVFSRECVVAASRLMIRDSIILFT
jgi:hypothetical protein